MWACFRGNKEGNLIWKAIQLQIKSVRPIHYSLNQNWSFFLTILSHFGSLQTPFWRRHDSFYPGECQTLFKVELVLSFFQSETNQGYENSPDVGPIFIWQKQRGSKHGRRILGIFKRGLFMHRTFLVLSAISFCNNYQRFVNYSNTWGFETAWRQPEFAT